MVNDPKSSDSQFMRNAMQTIANSVLEMQTAIFENAKTTGVLSELFEALSRSAKEQTEELGKMSEFLSSAETRLSTIEGVQRGIHGETVLISGRVGVLEEISASHNRNLHKLRSTTEKIASNVGAIAESGAAMAQRIDALAGVQATDSRRISELHAATIDDSNRLGAKVLELRRQTGE